MKINKKSKTIVFVTREDGTKFMIAKVKTSYEVYAEGVYTGYKFRSLNKALEYCEFGY